MFATRILTTLSMLITTAHCAAQSPGPGDDAPPITIEHLLNAPQDAAKPLEWSELPHDVAIVEFWGTWCAPCVAAIPHLNELHDAFHERISFLSVTFENTDLVKRFTNVRSMKSWIGCDTDRSMVDAYSVQSWPTTFIIRDGVIVARTHPTSITEDRLRDWLDGKTDAPIEQNDERNSDAPETVGPDGRPPVGPFMPGTDPFSKLDEVPTFQLIIREAGEASTWGTRTGGGTLLGVDVRRIVSMLWNLPRYAVQGDDRLDGGKYDVIYNLPHRQTESLMPLVRQLAQSILEIDVEVGETTLPGYVLEAADTGVTLPPGVSEHAGSSTQTSGDSITITSAAMTIDTLAGYLSGALDAPVDSRVESTEPYFIELTIDTTDDDALRRSLREQAGLVLTQVELPVTVATITRTSDS